MKILGIDPGMAIVGYSLLKEDNDEYALVLVPNDVAKPEAFIGTFTVPFTVPSTVLLLIIS